MSVNLLSMAQNAIGGPIMDQVSGMLGEDRGKTESAIGASLPAILGGLMQTAATPNGSREIARMADEADGGILDNLGDMLSNNSGALLSIGGPLLAMLFGGKQDGLISTIARMAGIGGGSAGSLLKLLAPVVMSLLGRQKSEQNLDEGGLRSLLMDQREHVAGAMPAEVSSTLNFGDFLDEQTRSAETVQPQSHAQPVSTAPHSTPDAPGGGGMMRWLLPLVILAGLAYFAYSYFGGDSAQMEQTQATAEMSTKLTDTLGGVATSISGITDEESARSAVETITSATETVEGMNLEGLEGTAKTAISGVVGPIVETIRGALEKVYEIPGVKGIVEPAITPLLAKLEGL